MENETVKFDNETPMVMEAAKVRSVMGIDSETGLVGNVAFDLLVNEAGKNIAEAVKVSGDVLPTLGDANKRYSFTTGSAGRTLTHGATSLVFGANKQCSAFWDGVLKVWLKEDEVELPTVPVKNEYGQSEVDASSQKLVTLLKEDFDSKIKLITNDEYLYAIEDENKVLLWGKRRDGTTYDCDLSTYEYTDSQILAVRAIITDLTSTVNTINVNYLPKSAVKNEVGTSTTDPIAQKIFSDLKASFDAKFSIVENEEFLYAIQGKNGTLLWGKRRDGSTYDCDNTDTLRIDSIEASVPLQTIKLISNQEFAYAILGPNDIVLWGKRRDGTTYDPDDSLTLIIKSLENSASQLAITLVSSPEFAYAILGPDKTILWGKRRDGSTYDSDSSIKDELNLLDSRVLVLESSFSIVSNPEYLMAFCDKDKKLIGGINRVGQLQFFEANINTIITSKLTFEGNGLTDLENDLKNDGFLRAVSDWSDSSSIRLPISRVACKINIVIPVLPVTKTNNYKGYIEYYDYEGNYFRKNIVLNAQGNSSMLYDKKNFTIDLDDGSKIKFGNWVEQDSWHLKAHYTDAFKSNNNAAYDMFEALANARPYASSRVWDSVLQSSQTSTAGTGIFKKDYDTGARGFPDGFPCAMYNNGEFYGIYMWNLKKHRDNYKMDRGNINHIHLDGDIGAVEMFDGSIDWTKFEIRNPSPRLSKEGWKLETTTGAEYNPDAPTEIASTGNSGIVKASIQRLADTVNAIKANPTKATFEQYFDNIWMFSDYLITANVVGNGDAFLKNGQYVSYDGLKFSITPYDWDGGLGVDHLGNFCNNVPNSLLGVTTETPMKYFYQIYKSDIKDRYNELSTKGFLTLDNIFSFYKNRIEWIGYENFDKENKKWANMPSYRSPNINPQWRLKANTIVTAAINYNPLTTYTTGQEVVYGIDNERYVFIANENVTGVAPISSFYPLYPKALGFYNSEQRIYKWLSARIAITTTLFNTI